MNAEDRLRAAFSDRATRLGTGRSTYADVRARVARRRRDRLATGASASLALAGLAALAVVVSGPGPDRVSPTDTFPTELPTALPSTAPTAAPTAAPTGVPTPNGSNGDRAVIGPDEFVGVHGGRLVVGDARTGKVLRALVKLPGDASWTYDVELSPERDAVFYSATAVGGLACSDDRSGTVRSFDVETGEDQLVASGGAQHPRLSSDGTRLLYVRNCDVTLGGTEQRMAVVVHDYAHPSTTTIPFVPGDQLVGTGRPSVVDADWMPKWGPDVFVFAASGDEATHLRSIKIGRDQTLNEGTVMAQMPIDAVRTDAEDVFLITGCCHEEFDGTQLVRRISRLGTAQTVLDRPGRRLDVAVPRADGRILIVEEGRLMRYDGPGLLAQLGAGWQGAVDW